MKVGLLGLWLMCCVGVTSYAALSLYRFYHATPALFVLSAHSSVNSLSEKTTHEITEFFKLHARASETVPGFIQKLQATFPVIKTVTSSCKAQRTVELKIDCCSPIGIFNDTVAITDNGKHVDHSCFNPTLVAQIPHFFINEDLSNTIIQPDCTAYLCSLDPTVHEQYKVVWVNASRIEFYPKKYPQVIVLGSTETGTHDVLDPACCALVAQVGERKPNRKGTKNDWVIDTRFKGQMIVFPGGKGAYEKGVCG